MADDQQTNPSPEGTTQKTDPASQESQGILEPPKPGHQRGETGKPTL